MSYCFYTQLGWSVLVISMLLLWFCSLLALMKVENDKTKALSHALKAFLNDDPTFVLEKKHPLAKQFNQVYQELSESKFKASEKADYLYAIMAHLDSALLIVNDRGEVIQTNPKSNQLIGTVRKIDVGLGDFGDFIINSKSSRRGVVNLTVNSFSDAVSIQVSCIQLYGKALKLVTFQFISQALVSQEYKAYSGLTKVLTHEVLNSITPMKSLSQTVLDMLTNPQQLIDRKSLKFAMETIVSRSKQLTSFVESFKQISSLPKLKLEHVAITQIISNVLDLLSETIVKEGIEVKVQSSANYCSLIDPVQIDQCILNLLNNAIYAASCSKTKAIILHLYENDRTQLTLDIEDFGAGIEAHVVENIFIPFFTTKSNGSGIGLSLSKQIMSAHGGDLAYVSKPTEGALFRLIFP